MSANLPGVARRSTDLSGSLPVTWRTLGPGITTDPAFALRAAVPFARCHRGTMSRPDLLESGQGLGLVRFQAGDNADHMLVEIEGAAEPGRDRPHRPFHRRGVATRRPRLRPSSASWHGRERGNRTALGLGKQRPVLLERGSEPFGDVVT